MNFPEGTVKKLKVYFLSKIISIRFWEAKIKFLKTLLLSKMVQLGGFLVRLLGLLIKTSLFWIGNALKPLVKRIFVLLVLTAAASETDAVI